MLNVSLNDLQSELFTLCFFLSVWWMDLNTSIPMSLSCCYGQEATLKSFVAARFLNSDAAESRLCGWMFLGEMHLGSRSFMSTQASRSFDLRYFLTLGLFI